MGAWRESETDSSKLSATGGLELKVAKDSNVNGSRNSQKPLVQNLYYPALAGRQRDNYIEYIRCSLVCNNSVAL
jgi:hypothetical protein